MKVEVLKENLKLGLNTTERIIGKNLTLPILNNVLITTEESFLNFTSTNLEIVIKLWVLGKISKNGKVVVPVKLFSSFISSLLNGKITIESHGYNLHINSEGITTQIQGYNPEEYPIIPEFKNSEYLEVDNKKICQGLSQVIDNTSSSQTRPEISGIYFSFSKNTIKMVATDSFRLAEKIITLEKPLKKEYSFILPQKSAREIINILEEKEGSLLIYFSDNQVLFESPMKEVKHPQVQISSRLIEGEYPNYQDIIPNKFKTNVTVNKEEFLSQLKTASLFSGKTNEVKVLINNKKNQVEIFTKSQDVGESISTLPAKIEGEAVEVSFNYKYLIDGLSNIKSSEVAFNISKEDGPCILKPVGDFSYLYVVMPIKAI